MFADCEPAAHHWHETGTDDEQCCACGIWRVEADARLNNERE